MLYIIFNAIITIMMIFAIIYDILQLYIVLLLIFLLATLYLVAIGKATPNAKALIYEYFITNYDKIKKEEYLERISTPKGVFIEDQYPSAILAICVFLDVLSCIAYEHYAIAAMTFATLVIIQIFHIIMSFRSLKRDRW